MDEVNAGVLHGPFYDEESLPCQDPSFTLRSGIWECHGESAKPGDRNIDNMLSNGLNTTAGCTHSHRPTDVDAIVCQTRPVAERSPSSKLSGFTSDFAKAYKQVPGDPTQTDDMVIAQYDPITDMVAFFVAYSLLFGSKTVPVNFARFPAVFCDMIARLFLIPCSHCVDDMIIIEEEEVAVSGKQCWSLFAEWAGWLLSAEKEMEPSALFTAIGISVNLRPFPHGDPTILVTKRRVASLLEIIKNVLDKKKLGSGEAASIAGKLGFTLSSAFGKVGRCRVRPIMNRAYSSKHKIDKVLVACFAWWQAFLNSYRPRPVPTSLESLPLVISYSDGEGGLAGIGAALWHPNEPRPLAVYAEVPPIVRAQWQAISGSEEYSDIFLVEALGPLMLLSTFPKHLKNCQWIHFIDNSAAESSLIRGASSSVLGDHIIGLTWDYIQKRTLWAYFDRVESKANPVDGLSLGTRPSTSVSDW